ncbi:DNA-binding protein [uncultured Bacteroides sp.]|uniref:HU family DNA-binding protein n=1 Tax=uncultured Bacteroides sp. TaxID=162156 RepID=UPI0025DB7846|nr:DNA-binding protein [uncultured Bacteroides sp.]
MSAYYDLFESPDVQHTGEPQPLYARFVPKGTMGQEEFIDRVHRFTGISHSLLQGAMKAFTDELRDSLANGWTVEFGELGYFTPSLNSRRVMDKKELRSASVSLRGLNFRLSKPFFRGLNEKISFERRPAQEASSNASRVLSKEECLRLLQEYLQKYPCINRAQYSQLTGRSRKQAIVELNAFIQGGVLAKHGMGKTVVYVICR